MGRHKHQTGTLELDGEGRVQVKPDIVTVRLAILTEGKTAEEAVSQNAARANDVVERLIKLGIARDAMTTVGLNLYPVYESDPHTGKTTLVGYRAQDSISVVASVDLAGKVFDAGVAAGANESSGLSFGLKDERPHREKALALAVEAARAEAEAIAKAMDVRITGPRTITVLQGSGPIEARGASMLKADTPVLPGELSITASIRVVFEYET